MTPTPGSATPEGNPTAREAISAFVHAQRFAFRSVIARGDFTEDLIDWIEARDAVHAETLRRGEAALRADFAEAIVNVLALETSFWPRDREEIAAKILTEVTRIRAATAQAMKEGTNG